MTTAAPTCHGDLLEVMGTGLLITGPPGVGKSTLALELIGRGHKLVANDVVELRRRDDHLLGCRPPGISPVLHLRAVGMVPVAAVFGEAAIARSETRIALVLHLGKLPAQTADTRLEGHRDHWSIGGIDLPRLWLNPTAGSCLATLAEVAVKLVGGPGSNLGYDFISTSAGAS